MAIIGRLWLLISNFLHLPWSFGDDNGRHNNREARDGGSETDRLNVSPSTASDGNGNGEFGRTHRPATDCALLQNVHTTTARFHRLYYAALNLWTSFKHTLKTLPASTMFFMIFGIIVVVGILTLSIVASNGRQKAMMVKIRHNGVKLQDFMASYHCLHQPGMMERNDFQIGVDLAWKSGGIAPENVYIEMIEIDYRRIVASGTIELQRPGVFNGTIRAYIDDSVIRYP